MSLQPVLRYSLDLSGNSPNNLVVGEVHSLTPVAPNRSIAPYYGSFYTQGFKVRDVGGTIDAIAYENIPLTGSAPLVIGSVSLGDSSVGFKRVRLSNQTIGTQNGFYQYTVSGSIYTLTPMALGALLTPGVDYVPTMLHQDATRVSGKEVCQLIVITNQTLLGDVVLEYQTVGGEYSVSSDALDQLIEALNLDNRPVVWGEIIGLPNAFPPVDHIHHIQDFKGFGHVIDALDDIRAMLSGELVIGAGGGNAIIHVGPTPPVGPSLKTLWWNNETLRLFIYYEDLTGGNIWVEISGSGGTGTAPSGGGTPELVTGTFPAVDVPGPGSVWNYIGSVDYIPVAPGPNDVSVATLMIQSSAYVAQLLVQRSGGSDTKLTVLHGAFPTNGIYHYIDTVNNKIELFIENVESREAMFIWSTDIDVVTLSPTTPVPYTPPATSAEWFLIPGQTVVYNGDIEPILLAFSSALNNTSLFFEQNQRVISYVPPL